MLPHETGLPDSTVPPARRGSALSSPQPVAGRIGAPLADGSSMASVGSQAQSSGPDLMTLLSGLQRRWFLALAIGLIVASAVAVGVWYLLSPPYQAFAQLRISSRQPDLLAVNQEGRNEFNTYLRSQAALIKTRMVLNKALIREEVKRLNLEKQHADPVAWLEERLKVDFQNDNEVVKVVVTCPNPSEAKVLVRAVTNAYRDEFVKEENAIHRGRVAELEKKYSDSKEDLRNRKKRLEELNTQLGTVNSEQIAFERADRLNQLTAARAEYRRATMELIKGESELRAHEAQESLISSTPIPDRFLNTVLSSDPEMKQYQADLIAWQRVLDQHIQAGTLGTRGYRVARSKVTALKKDVEARETELKKVIEDKERTDAKIAYDARMIQLKKTVALLQAQEKAILKNINDMSGNLTKMTQSTTEKEMLEDDIQRREGLLATVGNRLELSRLALHAGERVQFPAGVALEQRNHKKQILATGLGFCGSFGMVCFGIGWWEYRRRRVQHASQVSNSLGMRVLGTIPHSRNVETLLLNDLVESVEDDLFLESIASIRTTLLHQAQVEGMKVLMITSAEDGEGKTVLASHLASSLARAGRKTLFIDADLRFPGAHDLFEVRQDPGLCDILVSEADTVDAIQPTTIDGLMLLPAGQCDREVLQALARDGLGMVMQKLREEFDHIIIDSHPVLGATDSLLVGQATDAVLMTVLRDVSHLPHIQAATQRLMSVGIPVVGAVVNGLDPEEAYTNGGVNYTTAAG